MDPQIFGVVKASKDLHNEDGSVQLKVVWASKDEVYLQVQNWEGDDDDETGEDDASLFLMLDKETAKTVGKALMDGQALKLVLKCPATSKPAPPEAVR